MYTLPTYLRYLTGEEHQLLYLSFSFIHLTLTLTLSLSLSVMHTHTHTSKKIWIPGCLATHHAQMASNKRRMYELAT